MAADDAYELVMTACTEVMKIFERCERTLDDPAGTVTMVQRNALHKNFESLAGKAQSLADKTSPF